MKIECPWCRNTVEPPDPFTEGHFPCPVCGQPLMLVEPATPAERPASTTVLNRLAFTALILVLAFIWLVPLLLVMPAIVAWFARRQIKAHPDQYHGEKEMALVMLVGVIVPLAYGAMLYVDSPGLTAGNGCWAAAIAVALQAISFVWSLFIVVRETYRSRRMVSVENRWPAVTTVILTIGALLFAGTLALIPSYTMVGPRSHNVSAESAALNAAIAESVHFQNSGGQSSGRYVNRLADLLQWDNNLTDDPEVTFTFGPCNSSGYTFTTTHAKGDTSYVKTK